MLDLSALDKITTGTALPNLSQVEMTAIQRGLAICAYPTGGIDGLYGPRTRSTFAELTADIGQGASDVVSAAVLSHLKTRKDDLNALFAETGTGKSQVEQQIGQMFKFIGLPLPAQIAYGLATTDWETAHTFKPVREAFWETEAWRKENLRYFPYYGRGYVQLTWKRDYSIYGDILGLDLVTDPDLALRPDVALFVLGHGMKTGAFTGRGLGHYVNATETDFINARRVINGTNKASEIAALAVGFLKQLKAKKPAVAATR